MGRVLPASGVGAYVHPVADRAAETAAGAMRVMVEQVVREVAREYATDPTPKGLYSVREAAGWLGVSESLVRDWVDRGVIASVRPPDGRRLVRIRREDLEAFRRQWKKTRLGGLR